MKKIIVVGVLVILLIVVLALVLTRSNDKAIEPNEEKVEAYEDIITQVDVISGAAPKVPKELQTEIVE